MTKNRLKWNAVPTLFNVPNPPKTLSTPRRTMKRERDPTMNPHHMPRNNKKVSLIDIVMNLSSSVLPK